MEQKKVTLPREVAEALDKAKQDYPDIDFLAWLIPQWEKEGGYKKVIYDFSDSPRDNSFLKLIDALRYGYESEPEPIIVTITTEMQERLKQYYESLDPDKQADAIDREFVLGERSGIRFMLDQLGIQIDGVNA